jgi:hypothetical protein
MSNTQWTDAFLDQKRQKADKSYDDNIKGILDAAFLNEDHKGIFADWVQSQSHLVAEVTQIADALPKEGDLAHATIRKIDQLYVDQNQQYEILDKWRSHIWPQEFRFHIDSTRLATLLACKALANRQLEAALSAMNCALTNAAFLEGRFGQLAAQVAAEPGLKKQIGADNLAAYNRFLQISEDVRRSPGLFLCEDAFRKAQFRSYPEILHDTFTPAPCPGWVDEEKLRIGFRLWQEHMAGCVLVLFTHSLPACYLDAKGIPLLYRSERLLKQEFLAHRIYETGFFLKDVMDEGGLSVLADTGAMHTAWFAAAVHKFRPDLTFELGRCLDPCWTDAQGKIHTYWELLGDRGIQREYWGQQAEYRERHGAIPDEYSASDLGCHSFERLFRNCMQHDVDLQGRRLWGRGFLTATKVRYLHASMRYMALGDHVVQENGQPINQEDMAYTLLTIGYVIPLGLEKLGGILSRQEKEAFLHCWKVVGHVMGVDDDLLTDDWDEAKELYEKIKSRQQAPSERGVKLTNALCTLIKDLLPAWLPFRSAIAPVLIRDQMGADADDVFDARTKTASRNLLVRGCWAFAKHVLLRVYFLSRYWFFDRIAPVRAFIDHQVQFMANSMIECFQQTYERERFDLFSQEKGITANPDITQAEQEKRVAIRDRTYTWATIGVVLIVLFHPLFWIGTVSLAVSYFSSAAWLASAAKTMFCLCLVNVIGVTIIEGRLKACLQALAFKVPSKFLI